MKNINVSIYREYYDQIKSGQKKFEYRKITDYYIKKLLVGGYEPGKPIKARHYDTITFYCKTAPPMKVEYKGLFLYPKTNPEYFAIRLGAILSNNE